jgi:G3E family GTPase
MATPVTVVTGFLGSGKTTLISRLLPDPRLVNAAVIVNEFGEVGLDHALVEPIQGEVVLLARGVPVLCTEW